MTLSASTTTSWVEVKIWTTVEVSVGVICSCFPAWRALIMHLSCKRRSMNASRSPGHHVCPTSTSDKVQAPQQHGQGEHACDSGTMDGSTIIATTISTSMSHHRASKGGRPSCTSDDKAMELTRLPKGSDQISSQPRSSVIAEVNRGDYSQKSRKAEYHV